LLGEAGVGKSRLVREFLKGVEAGVVVGRCVSYGEGVTYRPIVEIVSGLGGADEQSLTGCPGAAQVLRSLLGATDAETSTDEIAWAWRKLLEAAAAKRPLVVVLDDIHWGTPAFLDLVEHTVDHSRDAPILLVCMARPELLEHRPTWAGGKLNATTVLLEPLDDTESSWLMAHLLGARHLEPELADQIRTTAGGNPLYLEEMLTLIEESGRGGLVIPPTVRALLAARLDHLATSERSVLERGAIEGNLFHAAAVVALDPEGTPVEREVEELVRKELLRGDVPQLPVGDAYRFRHQLLRDAAYDALPKAIRATLHERFSTWLEGQKADLIEKDDIVGYHLEQAHSYRRETGHDEGETRALGERAATSLLAAALGAGARGDIRAVVNLLQRALALGLVDPRERARVQVELGYGLYEAGRLDGSDAILAEALESATELGEDGIAARARVQRAWLRTSGDPDCDFAEMQRIAEDALEIFTTLDDKRGLVHASRLRFQTLSRQGRSIASEERERTFQYAEASGDRELYRRELTSYTGQMASGPLTAAEMIVRLESLLESAHDDRVLEAVIKRALATAYAWTKRFDEAVELVRESSSVLDELDRLHLWVYRGGTAGVFELAGDLDGAERVLKENIAYFRSLRPDRIDVRGLGTSLASFYCNHGRWEDADKALAYGREVHVRNRAMLSPRLAVEARVAAHRGELDEALALVERALGVFEESDKEPGADIWCAVAEVCRFAGLTDRADAAEAEALAIYESKGNLAAVEQRRARSGVPGKRDAQEPIGP
jgi:hypothetical protein